MGGGTSLSMLRTLADAYKVQAMAGERLTAWKALHAATLGAAHGAAASTHEIGSLDVGRTADLCVWDWAVGRSRCGARTLARDLHERMFAFMSLGDERNW